MRIPLKLLSSHIIVAPDRIAQTKVGLSSCDLSKILFATLYIFRNRYSVWSPSVVYEHLTVTVCFEVV
jgi:hypothetical protein